MAVCDTVFFLDYPTEVCLAGIEARRGKVRPDMPWVENEEDAEFLEFIRQFQEQKRPQVYALLEQYREKDIFVFHDRAEADIFLRQTFPDS